MKRVLLLFIACTGLSLFLSAQPICGFDKIQNAMLNNNPSIAQLIRAKRIGLNEYMIGHPQLRIQSAIDTIPVVVHIMHTGGAIGTIYNPDDAVIEDAINYLNEIYAGTAVGIVSPPLGGGDMGIRFALAKRSPANECTNSIVRVNASSLNNYSLNGVNADSTEGCQDIDLKNLSRWDSTRYYNIWVVNKIDEKDGYAGSGQFIAGYAYFPEGAPGLDGMVILASQMIRGESTLAHELGHALFQYHTFEGSSNNAQCPVNNNCMIEGDWICDTDPITMNFDAVTELFDFSCRTGINPCTGTLYTKKTESNIMNYLENSCGMLFTDGQAISMKATLYSLDRRASLIAPNNKALRAPEIRVYNNCNTPVFTTNNFTAIGVGKDGHVWAGTANQGLYKWDGTGWTKNPSANPSINLIQDIKADRLGGIWVAQSGNTGAQATTGGLNYYPDTSFTTGAMYYGATVGLPTRYAKSLFIDTSRYNGPTFLPLVWSAHMAHITAGVSTSGGLGRGLNPVTPFFNTYRNGVETTNGLGSCQALGGNASEIWIYAAVNFGESQILRYNATTTTLITPPITYSTPGNNSIFQSTSFQVKAIYFDKHGRKWIGLVSGGVVINDNTNWYRMNDVNLFLPGVLVNTNAITGDQYGNVYIGTTNGLVIYKEGGRIDLPESYKRYGVLDQLPSANIKGICVDTLRKQLLLATDAGVVFYNPSCSPANFFEEKIMTTANAGDWNLPATWCNGTLPDINTKVFVKHAVTLNTNTTCKSVELLPGGSVTVATGVILNITSQ